MRRPAGLALLLIACACGKSSGEGVATASPPASAVASAAPSAAIPSPSASAAGSTVAARAMRGTYKTAAGALAVTSDWAKTHFASPESTDGIGDGSMTVQIDAAGHVTGALDGALGAAVLEGVLAGDQLTAAIRRKDPADRGFAGTLVGTLAADHATGTMSLASAQGGVVRTGTFTLSADAGH